MRKKIAILICMSLLISIGITPFGGKTVHAADHATEIINAIGIMETDKGNTEIGTDIVTRSRFAQMLVNLSLMKDDVSSESNVSLFSDVKKNYWAAGYIQTAINQGWMSGYLNGSFKPEQGISLQEAVYGIIKLLGYTNEDFNGNRNTVIMQLYKTKGLNQNISKTKADYLSVNDCIYLFYNTLNASTKDGKVYASLLGYSLDSYGKLDYLSFINTEISGPIIVDDDWKTELPFSTVHATMYKYGVECTYSDIQDYDVMYYSESFKTIWIYDEKVTGPVDSINPDYATPQSVTVAGNNYSFADSDVAIKFSTMGTVKKGEIVTLLLGREGTVVDVLSIDEYNTTITGVVLEIGTHIVEDKSGNYVNTNYVTFVDASGNEYKQDYDVNTFYLLEGELIRITYVDGIATASEFVLENVSFGNNTFNSDGSALGDLTIASNAKLLDLKEDQYISIYPERLAGITLGGSTVYYYELNSKGEIAQLILCDVTGDMDEFGVFTGITYSNTDKVNYEYLIGDKSGSLSTNNLSYLSLEEGPMNFIVKNNAITESNALTGVVVTSIGSTTIQSSTMKYPLAEQYYVYCLLNGEYIPTTLDKISDLSKYDVKAYYDNPISLGGRIRVIVAESKN